MAAEKKILERIGNLVNSDVVSNCTIMVRKGSFYVSMNFSNSSTGTIKVTSSDYEHFASKLDVMLQTLE